MEEPADHPVAFMRAARNRERGCNGEACWLLPIQRSFLKTEP